MSSEIETAEQRLKTFRSQLLTECGILERLVYKHKNQHQRCSYFQYLLKVRRDLKLLQSANLEEVMEASFMVINGDRPKQKVQLLESLKRRRCSGGKCNFLKRLLGVTRLLSQMVEPLLKAAMEISTLLARSFFMKLSLMILAVLARIRVLIQQMLLDAVFVYNTVSSLSQREQTVKLNQEGFEVFREYYPRKEDATIMLECLWQTDKYVLVERTDKSEVTGEEKDDSGDFSSSAQKILYENIEVLLGVDETGAMAAEHPSADPLNVEENRSDPGVTKDEKNVQEASDAALSTNINSLEDVFTNSSVETISETSSKMLIDDSCITRTPDSKSIYLPASSLPLSFPVKKEMKKKVAFIAVKPPAPSTTKEPRFDVKGTEKNDEKKEDPFFNLLSSGTKQSSLL